MGGVSRSRSCSAAGSSCVEVPHDISMDVPRRGATIARSCERRRRHSSRSEAASRPSSVEPRRPTQHKAPPGYLRVNHTDHGFRGIRLAKRELARQCLVITCCPALARRFSPKNNDDESLMVRYIRSTSHLCTCHGLIAHEETSLHPASTSCRGRPISTGVEHRLALYLFLCLSVPSY